MKLEQVIQYFDGMLDVVVYDNDDTEDPLFKGSILNIPWTIVKCDLAKDANGEAFYIDHDELIIYINL